MWSIVVKRASVMVSAAFVFGFAGPALAAKADTEAAVVARLYKDFAWQALSSQAALFGDDITHQGKPVLNRYFTPTLADLLVKDASCQARQQGICNLDSDILFASQDPRVTDLDIQAMATGRVMVTFRDPVTDESTRIDFEMVRVAGSWKIGDIIYKRDETISLKKNLSAKIH